MGVASYMLHFEILAGFCVGSPPAPNLWSKVSTWVHGAQLPVSGLVVHRLLPCLPCTCMRSRVLCLVASVCVCIMYVYIMWPKIDLFSALRFKKFCCMYYTLRLQSVFLCPASFTDGVNRVCSI